jgi:hypothetical protein
MSDLRKAKLNYSENCAREEFAGPFPEVEIWLNKQVTHVSLLHKSFGRYDLTVPVDSDASFPRQLAGRVQTGRHSMSDPAIGAATPQTVDAD